MNFGPMFPEAEYYWSICLISEQFYLRFNQVRFIRYLLSDHFLVIFWSLEPVDILAELIIYFSN